MLNLGGFSAAYPGYQAAEATQATTETNQAAAKEAALKLLGQHVLGRALTGGQPDQGPQPPAPGQPSAPNAPQGGGPAPTPMQGGPAPTPAPAPSAAPSGTPEITLPALTQRILATSPRVKDHPEVLMAALERAAPLLDRQSKEDLAELRKEMSTQRLKQTGELAQARIDASKAVEAGRQGRFDVREARLTASTAVRQDQGWQRLEQQKQDIERKVQQGGDRTALSQWRAIVDAQHKRATEIIQSNSVMSGFKDEEKKALLDEQRSAYEAEIAGMRGKLSQPVASPATPAPATAPAPATTGGTVQPPPVAMLKPGGVNIIDGVGWRLVNGQPVQVPLPGQ